MNYFNESTSEMTGDELYRKLLPINTLKVIEEKPLKVKEDFKMTHRNYPQQDLNV